MAFTVYIFKEDGENLRTVLSSLRTGASLFGQWTSTGNPVVHFVARNPTEETRGIYLYENYRLCHIGEWRPTYVNSFEDGPNARRSLLSKNRKQGRLADTPARFLVLDVNNREITPYLLSKEREQRGNVEYLEGSNPFASQRQYPDYTMIRNQPSYQQYAASQIQPSRGHAPSQSQAAEVKSNQWYSTEEGKGILQMIHEEFQSIAQSRQVQMTRNTETHDMSMFFTDYRRKQWEVRFPPDFPRQGATLIEKTESWYRQGVEQKVLKQPDTSDVRKAVERMVRQIQGSTWH